MQQFKTIILNLYTLSNLILTAIYANSAFIKIVAH